MWVHVGKVPEALNSAGSIVLPTGDLLVIGGWIGVDYSARVFKASFTGEDQLLGISTRSVTPIL